MPRRQGMHIYVRTREMSSTLEKEKNEKKIQKRVVSTALTLCGERTESNPLQNFVHATARSAIDGNSETWRLKRL